MHVFRTPVYTDVQYRRGQHTWFNADIFKKKKARAIFFSLIGDVVGPRRIELTLVYSST